MSNGGKPRITIGQLKESRFGKDINKKIEELKKEFWEEASQKFYSQLRTSERHDMMINICMLPFLPNGKCFEELGYTFISVEPLLELGVKNFDLLILNRKKKYAIFVECKSSISTNARDYIIDGYKAIEEIVKNKSYLENSIGNEIKIMEFVFCVPAGGDRERLVKQIEIMENKGEIDDLASSSYKLMKELKDEDKLDFYEKPRFLVWELTIFNEQCLTLFTRINSRKEKNLCQHKDTELTRLLGRGVSADEGTELFVRMHPSSHPYTKGLEIISEVFDKNKEKNEEDRIFSYELINRFLQDKSTISHYAQESLSKKIAAEFIKKSLDFGIIEDLGNSQFRLKLKGKKWETVKENYKRKYHEGAINKIATKYAEEKIIEEFEEKHTSLFDSNLFGTKE